jgi:hypothetical protein
MRATSTQDSRGNIERVVKVIRARIGRWWTPVSVTVLLASQVFVGTASAADTRLIYVGSGPVGTAPGVLTLSPVTVGGTTATNVIVKNIDNQNLSHVVLTFPGATPDVGLSLSGWFPSGSFPTNASSCNPTATSSLVCDFGNLAAGQTRTLTVLYNATAAGPGSISASITFNETRPNTGKNTHIEPIGGTVSITNGGCDAVATFLPPGQVDKVIGTGCTLSSSNPQITSISVPASIVSAIRVADEPPRPCPEGLTCFGEDSVADIAIDTTATVTWTITWLVPANFNTQRLGVIHYKDDGSLDFAITYKKNLCTTANPVSCFVPGSVTLSGTTLTAVIRTSGNGAMKGFS